MAKVYGGRWEVIDPIAAGGQAEVFRVRDLRSEYTGELALKRVLNPKRHPRFVDEVEAIKRLDHPNVIRLIDHSALNVGDGEIEKQFLVMPLAAAGDLSRRAGLYKDNADSVVQVAKQLANALKAAHDAGIIHRDVKPANIVFASETHDPWLCDFGICLIRDQDRSTGIAEVVGPVQFMAPELEGGGQLDVTPAADVYSLGKVTYFMLSGGTTLPRERLHEPEYSRVFERGGQRQRLLQNLLSKMICPLATRLRTMGEVLVEIERIDIWSRDARVLPVSANALAGLEALQKRSIEKQRVAEENTVARSRRDVAVQNAKEGSLSWLKTELEKTRALIGHGGGLSSGVRSVSGENDVSGINELIPGEAVELWIRSTQDHVQREHVLRFSYCNKFSVRVSIQVAGAAMPPEPSEPEHAEVAILPAYGQLYPDARGQKPSWQLFTAQNALYSPAAPGAASLMQMRRMQMQPAHLNQPVEVQALTFSTETWPGVADLFPGAFQKAVDAFV